MSLSMMLKDAPKVEARALDRPEVSLDVDYRVHIREARATRPFPVQRGSERIGNIFRLSFSLHYASFICSKTAC